MSSSSLKNSLMLGGAVLGWVAVGLQLVLIIQNRVTPVPETLIRFFSFFTILTNIMVALCFSLLWLHRGKGNSPAWLTPARQTAVAVYILVVGIVYNVILRFLWAPAGLQRFVDEALHVGVPLLYFIYWFRFVPKASLQWKDALAWLLYPLVYLFFILVRGGMAATPYYPYPFLDVSKLGYQQVALNCMAMLVLFLLVSFMLIAIGRYKQARISTASSTS